jgi:hypothetical protein
MARHADVLEARKKDLFNDIETAPSRPAEGSTPEGRKEMVADDEAVDERAPEYATWVSEDSQSDSSPAETRATTDAVRNYAMPDEEHGRQVELHVDEVQSNEERGSKARVRSFAEEEALSNTSFQRRAAREEKGKEKVREDQSEYEREKNESESESEEGNERRSEEQPSDHESDAAVTESEEAEETDQEAKRRRKRKEKRRARSFLDNPDARLTKTEFFFCDYPFLLDPTTKARIMHIDAAMQMSYEVEVKPPHAPNSLTLCRLSLAESFFFRGVPGRNCEAVLPRDAERAVPAAVHPRQHTAHGSAAPDS